jgi:hypothetical protein
VPVTKKTESESPQSSFYFRWLEHNSLTWSGKRMGRPKRADVAKFTDVVVPLVLLDATERNRVKVLPAG